MADRSAGRQGLRLVTAPERSEWQPTVTTRPVSFVGGTMKVVLIGSDSERGRVRDLLRRACFGTATLELALPGPEVPLPELVASINQLLAEADVGAAVVVGGRVAAAATHEAVRQAVQAGLPVLTEVPLDPSADVHYELGVIAQETGAQLVPYWPMLADPCCERFAARARRVSSAEGAVLEIELDTATQRPLLADPSLAQLIGVAAELGFRPREVLATEQPTGELELRGFVSEQHALKLIVRQADAARVRLTLRTAQATICRWTVARACRFEDGLAEQVPGEVDRRHEPALAEEQFLTQFMRAAAGQGDPPANWDAALAAMAVLEAARYSMERKRTEPVTEGVASPETQFKATMTMWGCGLLWLLLLLVPTAVALESFGFAAAPALVGGLVVVLVLFLVVQFLKPRS